MNHSVNPTPTPTPTHTQVRSSSWSHPFLALLRAEHWPKWCSNLSSEATNIDCGVAGSECPGRRCPNATLLIGSASAGISRSRPTLNARVRSGSPTDPLSDSVSEEQVDGILALVLETIAVLDETELPSSLRSIARTRVPVEAR